MTPAARLQQALKAPMMISQLSPDPSDDFRRLALGLHQLTPSDRNLRGHEHVGYALQEPTSLLVATSESGQVLAALAYRTTAAGVYVRMLGATGIVPGAATALLCALAAQTPSAAFSTTVATGAAPYYAQLGWQRDPSLFDTWIWPLEHTQAAAELFAQSQLQVVYSDLPSIAYDLVDLPDLAV
jgi:hypothetical protein